MSTNRQCPTCDWMVPTFLPDDLVSAAMGDHRANDCSANDQAPEASDRPAVPGGSVPASAEGPA